MIRVEEALERILALARPVGTERVALARAGGRVLREPVVAGRAQPPFPASAMDGYAVPDTAPEPGTTWQVIGESAAGRGHPGGIGPGEAVRIFTGAPVPPGTARVIIQEDVTREGDRVTLAADPGQADNIRPAGTDFDAGYTLAAPRRLTPGTVSLIAAMGTGEVTVSRRPDVAILSTGDELVMPGEEPGPDQIFASNTFGLKALLEAEGADARILPIARDSRASLAQAFSLAEGADLLVTIGGASVGDHDLVGQVAAELGAEQSFYKVAMRPGKPLMAGRLGDQAMVGLPGNPVSALVCAIVFLRPMLQAMQGLPAGPAARGTARLAHDLPAGGPREHYMRARVEGDTITALPRQDSSLLTVFVEANALLRHPIDAPPMKAGEVVEYIPL